MATGVMFDGAGGVQLLGDGNNRPQYYDWTTAILQRRSS